MRRQALDHLREAIEANTQRRSIDQLKAEGKRHVRVVSGEKVLKIIKAIVGDIVDREVGELTSRDRERIVNETKQQFDRVMKLQSDQDALIREQKDLVEQFRAQAEEAERERDGLRTELEHARSEQGAREARMLSEYQERVRELSSQLAAQTTARETAEKQTTEALGQLEERSGRLDKAERILHKYEARFANAKTTIENYDRELARAIEERDRLRAEIDALRERAGESDAVGQLRGELAEMKSVLHALGERSSGPDAETVETLLARLAERESTATSSLEEKFNATLDRSLDKITKTMEAATARPIDVVVEATDVVIDKLFDHQEEVLSSNLDELKVEERKTKGGIAGSLEALRALRAGREPEQDEPDPGAEPPPAEEDPMSEGNHGPEAEAAVVPVDAKEKLSASMERLKAVREGDENGG